MNSIKSYDNTSLNNNTNINTNINYCDEVLNNTLNNMDLSEKTHQNYKYTMSMFLKCITISFNDLINSIKELQIDTIEDNKIIRYDPQNSLLKNGLDITNENNTISTTKLTKTIKSAFNLWSLNDNYGYDYKPIQKQKNNNRYYVYPNVKFKEHTEK